MPLKQLFRCSPLRRVSEDDTRLAVEVHDQTGLIVGDFGLGDQIPGGRVSVQ